MIGGIDWKRHGFGRSGRLIYSLCFTRHHYTGHEYQGMSRQHCRCPRSEQNSVFFKKPSRCNTKQPLRDDFTKGLDGLRTAFLRGHIVEEHEFRLETGSGSGKPVEGGLDLTSPIQEQTR